MTREEIIAKVNSLLAEEFEIEESEIVPEANIVETFHLDSLSRIDMIALVESNFKLHIQAEEIKTMLTFQDLYNYIETHIQ
ncbi:MAG TPA: acyl carrier protein [Porphyromonadaceae bacterium]|nr:acyl carrier protein [Porphyromonadaceae bacterium]